MSLSEELGAKRRDEYEYAEQCAGQAAERIGGAHIARQIRIALALELRTKFSSFG